MLGNAVLTRYYPKKKIRKEVSLIGGPKNATTEQEELDEEEKALTKEELELEVRSLFSFSLPSLFSFESPAD